jgi:tetratricopeptide (TPR) repeat protein
MHDRPLIAGLCLFACCLPVFAVAAPACRGPQDLELRVKAHPTSKDWASLGGWFGEQRQYDCAIPALRSAVGMEPGSASLHYYLGLALENAGQSADAMAELQRSVALDPNQLQPRLLLGVALNRAGRSAEAEEAWEAALHIDPSSVIAIDWLAKARIADGQFVAAIDLLSTAPNDEGLTLDLALAQSQSGQFDNAAETLKSALAKSPGDSRLSAALATVYVQSHRPQDATNIARVALEANPRDPALNLLYLRLLILQGDDATARPLARELLAAHPKSFDALYLSGLLEGDAQEWLAASEHLNAAIAIDPDHYDTRYHFGVALFHLEKNEAAREQLEKAVAIDPSQAEGHFHLAQVLRALGQTEKAKNQLKLFQDRQQATINLALGQNKAGQAAQALRGGDAAQAVALYREAIEALPQDPVLRYDLALAIDRTRAAQSEDLEQERAALEKAIELKPAFAAAENQLGSVGARAGDAAAAEKHFRKALQAAPRYADASNNLGTLLGQQGRDAEAEVHFRSAVSANPRFVRAWVNLAATLASQSRFTEARAAVESALKIEPQDDDALRLRRMLTAAHDDGIAATAPIGASGPSAPKKPN